MYILSVVTLLTALLALNFPKAYTAEIEAPKSNPHEIRVVPVDPTPEPDEVEVHITFPENNAVKVTSPVRVQLKVEGYPLATDSDFQRKREIFNSSKGQGIRVILDERTYFLETEALIDADNDTENYYDQTITFELPGNLKPGMHILRAFPVRSFNESLKGDGCFDANVFYYQKKKDGTSIDLTAPYLSYNEPQGDYRVGKNKPILLDFYISNCQLSRDGYKVRLSIDGSVVRTLTQWIPYYIYGLSNGSHTIRLELLDPQNKLVPGAFNDFKQQIHIKS